MEEKATHQGGGSGTPTFLGRSLLCLGAMLFLGFGLGLSVHKGASTLWTLGLLAALGVVMLLMARWQLRPLTEPLARLLGGTRSRALEELPEVWHALEQENVDLRQRAALEEGLLPGIMARLEEGVLLFGPLRQLEQYNPAAQRLLGLGAPLATGMGIDEVFSDAEGRSSIGKAYQGVPAEWRLTRSARTLRVRAIPFAPMGTVRGVLVTLDDVTRQEALETTRQKFISNVSHELKTPVTGIRIAAENLQAEPLEPSARVSAQSILRSVDRLTLLLGDLSELSRIESGALVLDPVTVELSVFLEGLMKDLQPRSQAAGVALRLEAPLPAGVTLHTDPLRLHQILENLVSNALKFSPPGAEVVLRVQVNEQGQAWEVRDQGPGISEADQARIFERFYRTKAAQAKPGTGLGLAIVKHLCRLMGGEVTLESRPGAGATFKVFLPRNLAAQEAAGPPRR